MKDTPPDTGRNRKVVLWGLLLSGAAVLTL